LDLRAGELRKRGMRVRLQEQPFQVLAMLVAHPGEVVSREDLRKKLWPADTFVDFDHGLNKAVNKIREALSDSAENPRFVETAARRGYRFLAAVTPAGEAVPGTLQARWPRRERRSRLLFAGEPQFRFSLCFWSLPSRGSSASGTARLARLAFVPWLSCPWKAFRPTLRRIISRTE